VRNDENMKRMFFYGTPCSKYASVYYRLRYIAAYWSEIATPCIRFGAPVRDEAVRFTQQPLMTKNWNDGPIRPWKNFNDTFSRFDRKHACDGQQTCEIGVEYTALSIASRGKNYCLAEIKKLNRRITCGTLQWIWEWEWVRAEEGRHREHQCQLMPRDYSLQMLKWRYLEHGRQSTQHPSSRHHVQQLPSYMCLLPTCP